MKLVITGRHGQLASSLIELAGRMPGLDVVAIGRPEVDLERLESIEAALATASPDIVINAAAYTAVDLAEDEPERAFMVNDRAAGEIARQCRRIGARLIHISTDYVFDGTQKGPYLPDSPTNPGGVYGLSKLGGERAIREQAPDHLIVRTAWVYSPFGRNFVKTMMQLARSRSEVTVVDDQHGNPTSALELAEGLLEVVAQWDKGSAGGLGQTYHLAGTGAASWADFARQIFAECRQLGLPACEVRPIASTEWPTRAHRPQNSMLDCSAFARDFGYRCSKWAAALKPVVARLAAQS